MLFNISGENHPKYSEYNGYKDEYFGWWQYDERTSLELAKAHATGEDICELLIAGHIYVIDLNEMVQYRKDDPNRKRYIKMDSSKISKKGIAGLRINDRREECENNFEQIESNSCWIENQIPITPSNTPQSPNSERQSPEEGSLLESFRSLQINALNNNSEECKNSPRHRSS